MNFLSVRNTIDIIFGPMFSGKTSELVNRLNIFTVAGYKVLYINSSFDTRGETFSTHNSSITNMHTDIKQIKTTKLMNLLDVNTYDIIGIDEAQFFEDLTDFSLMVCEVLKKKVIVSGLNGDFNRQSFGKILELIPYCDTVTKLYPFCALCRDIRGEMNPALFSKRLTKEQEKIVIGKEEKYLPVCRECYLE
jgi:thymidine kinase